MDSTRGRYEQLLQDLRAQYRPQREWIERQGLLLIVGHFLSGVAAGTWVFALAFQFVGGALAAYVLALLSGLAHLLFLGRPSRFWRMWHARTAWIARGFIGLNLFIVGGFFALAPHLVAATPWGANSWLSWAGNVVAMTGAVLMLLYKGFVYSSSKGIPFWNSPILPALYVAYGLRGGVAMLLVVIALFQPTFHPANLELIELWIGASALVMILFYLGVISGANPVARQSVHELLNGRVSISFYVGTLIVGLLAPIAMGILGMMSPLSMGGLAILGLTSVIGDFFVKYCIAKAGIYLPLTQAPRLRTV